MTTFVTCFYQRTFVDNFREHGITGEVFVYLTQDAEYLKELAPLIPDRVKLRKLTLSAAAIR